MGLGKQLEKDIKEGFLEEALKQDFDELSSKKWGRRDMTSSTEGAARVRLQGLESRGPTGDTRKFCNARINQLCLTVDGHFTGLQRGLSLSSLVL